MFAIIKDCQYAHLVSKYYQTLLAQMKLHQIPINHVFESILLHPLPPIKVLPTSCAVLRYGEPGGRSTDKTQSSGKYQAIDMFLVKKVLEFDGQDCPFTKSSQC